MNNSLIIFAKIEVPTALIASTVQNISPKLDVSTCYHFHFIWNHFLATHQIQTSQTQLINRKGMKNDRFCMQKKSIYVK